MSLAVVVSNSGLFRAKNKQQVPYKKQKAIRSNKKRCHLRLNERFGVKSASCRVSFGRSVIPFRPKRNTISADGEIRFARN